MIRFGGNDYLDLARQPRVVEAAAGAAREYGASSCASRVSVGTVPIHLQLEEALARFLGVEEAAVLSSGYLAALAVFNPFPDSLVFLDEGSHPSLQNGARASGAAIHPFRHFQAPALEEALIRGIESSPRGARRLVAVDGVDGFSGVVAPLDQLHRVCERHGALLIVDDAHGLGVLGSQGRGTAELFDLPPGGLLLAGSLGKALGSSGGWVAGGRELIQAVRGGAAYMGSTALAPSAAAAALAALELLREEPWRREQIQRLGKKLRQAVSMLGYAAGGPAARKNGQPVDFPVVTLIFSSAAEAARIAAFLLEQGIQIAYFSYAASGSSARLRIPLSTRHGEAEIERVIESLRRARAVI